MGDINISTENQAGGVNVGQVHGSAPVTGGGGAASSPSRKMFWSIVSSVIAGLVVAGLAYYWGWR